MTSVLMFVVSECGYQIEIKHSLVPRKLLQVSSLRQNYNCFKNECYSSLYYRSRNYNWAHVFIWALSAWTKGVSKTNNGVTSKGVTGKNSHCKNKKRVAIKKIKNSNVE